MSRDSSSDDSHSVIRSESRDVRSSQRIRELSSMTDEERDRYNQFVTRCSFPVAVVKSIMQKYAPEGSVIQNPAASVASSAAKLFVSEVAETARKLAREGQPITPDLIYLAFDVLLQKGLVPGHGSSVPMQMG